MLLLHLSSLKLCSQSLPIVALSYCTESSISPSVSLGCFPIISASFPNHLSTWDVDNFRTIKPQQQKMSTDHLIVEDKIVTSGVMVGQQHFATCWRISTFLCVKHYYYLLAGAARQPLFTVIMSLSIYLSIYVCLSAENCKQHMTYIYE